MYLSSDVYSYVENVLEKIAENKKE